MTLSEIASEIKAGRTSPAMVRELLDIAEKQQRILDHAITILNDWHAPDAWNGVGLSIGGRIHRLAVILIDRITALEAENKAVIQRNAHLQAELSAIDEALGEFYCPVVDGDGTPGGSFFKDHGVHLAVRRIEELQQQNALLQAQVRTTQTSVVADTVERQQATIRRLQAELERAQQVDDQAYYCPEHKYNPPVNSGFAFCPHCEGEDSDGHFGPEGEAQ